MNFKGGKMILPKDIPTREELMTEFQKKPIRRVLQFDANFHHPLDNVDPADEDGHTIWVNQVWDLRKTDLPVRVQILPDISKKDALILLNKIVKRIKEMPAEDFYICRHPDYFNCDGELRPNVPPLCDDELPW